MDAEATCEAIAQEQHGVISREQALAAGMPLGAIKRRLRNGRWHAVYPRIYAHGGSTPNRDQQLAATSLWLRDEGAISGTTAAEILELAGTKSEDIEVTSTRFRRPPSPQISVRRTRCLDPHDVTRHRGLRVTNVERTLFDLAARVLPWRLESCVNDALRRRLTTFPRLWNRLDSLAASGRNGTTLFRQTLAELDDGRTVTESQLETRVARVLRLYRAPAPERQVVVRQGTRFLGRLDFAYPTRKVAIEADSREWHEHAAAFEGDRARDQLLVAHGWIVIRVTWAQLNQSPKRFVDAVLAALSRPPSPPTHVLRNRRAVYEPWCCAKAGERWWWRARRRRVTSGRGRCRTCRSPRTLSRA